jgi:hypothetical protein
MCMMGNCRQEVLDCVVCPIPHLIPLSFLHVWGCVQRFVSVVIYRAMVATDVKQLMWLSSQSQNNPACKAGLDCLESCAFNDQVTQKMATMCTVGLICFAPPRNWLLLALMSPVGGGGAGLQLPLHRVVRESSF